MNKTELAKNVRAFREALGDTQQNFAYRMKWAISTAVRYESSRPPSGPVLIQLAKVARRNGLGAFANTFFEAFLNESGLDGIHFLAYKENPCQQPHLHLFAHIEPAADERLRAAVWAFGDRLIEAHSGDPEVRETALRKLDRAAKALPDLPVRSKAK